MYGATTCPIVSTINIVPMIAPKCARPKVRGRISGSSTGPPAEPTNQQAMKMPTPSQEASVSNSVVKPPTMNAASTIEAASTLGIRSAR